MSPTSLGQVAAMLRFFGSVSNLPLLTIGDYYYHSHDKMVKEKWRPGKDMVRVLVGVRGCVPRPTGHSLVILFSLSMLVKDQSLYDSTQPVTCYITVHKYLTYIEVHIAITNQV